jgi:hypothetical protein
MGNGLKSVTSCEFQNKDQLNLDLINNKNYTTKLNQPLNNNNAKSHYQSLGEK